VGFEHPGEHVNIIINIVESGVKHHNPNPDFLTVNEKMHVDI
jgi:hypothetical protein